MPMTPSPSRAASLPPLPPRSHRNRSHRARYLVLFGDDSAPRAALFDTHVRFLAEMIGDDAYAVDHLVRASTACAPPGPAMADTLGALDRDVDLSTARCFALGSAAATCDG